ncbi:MAG: MiaB/RimO family radical SAM methylthiotransferase, partial [bacterium]
MTGCDHACTFCIVPLVRGPEKGRPIADVVRDVSMQVDLGVREVTLLGQNVDHYRDPATGGDFADLLAAVDAVPGLWRVRFTTSNPRDMSDRVLEAVRDLPRVCEHLHLPVQSGSDPVLRRMGRGYTVGEYRALIDRARSLVPNASLTTDLIVGFCGESDDDFGQTLNLVNEIGFDGAYTFKYSPRPGTPAAHLTDDVPEPVKAERLARINSAIEASAFIRRRADLDTVQEILGETWEDAVAKGRT